MILSASLFTEWLGSKTYEHLECAKFTLEIWQAQYPVPDSWRANRTKALSR